MNPRPSRLQRSYYSPTWHSNVPRGTSLMLRITWGLHSCHIASDIFAGQFLETPHESWEIPFVNYEWSTLNWPTLTASPQPRLGYSYSSVEVLRINSCHFLIDLPLACVSDRRRRRTFRLVFRTFFTSEFLLIGLLSVLFHKVVIPETHVDYPNFISLFISLYLYSNTSNLNSLFIGYSVLSGASTPHL